MNKRIKIVKKAVEKKYVYGLCCFSSYIRFYGG